MDRRLGMDLRCVAQSVAVAHIGCLCRMSVRTGVNHGHLLMYERECIRAGRGVLSALTIGLVLIVV
jgi:hypothetical protein